jgi:hypothetical protein
MEFRLVERDGVPKEVMREFYDHGREASDFGEIKSRAESNHYETIVLAINQNVVGSSNIICYDGEAYLEGCYILPEYREELRENGKSAFEHMARARYEKVDLPAKTSATTEHGKTQHIYDKLDFSPYKFKLPKAENNSAYIIMADNHELRSFNHEMYVPDSIKDFVKYVSEGFNEEPDCKEGDYSGAAVESKSSESCRFKLYEGDQSLENALNQVLRAKKDNRSVKIDLDVGNSSAYAFISELLSEDFNPTAVEPVVEGSKKSQSPVLQLAYHDDSIEAELIPETREFLKKAGWTIETKEAKENSEDVEIIC